MVRARPNKSNPVSKLIAEKMIRYDVDNEMLAIKMRIAKSTLCNKKKNPDTMTLGEAKLMCQALHFDDEEIKMLIW